MIRKIDRPVSVVIPVFNEASTIRRVIERVSRADLVGDIIVVDDASTDGTREILSDLAGNEGGPTVLLQPENRGKGAAVRRGFRSVTRPVTIVQDADLEYDPADYARLARPVLEGTADVVYGSRFLNRGWRGDGLHVLGNRALTLWSNLFTGLHISDVHTCYKAIGLHVLQRLRLCRDRFDFDPELTVRLGRMGARILEVPITYRPRGEEEGKKIGWKDALEALTTTFRTALF